MYSQKPGDSGESGLGFANMLRDCLLAGVILIDFEQKVAILTPEAQHILGGTPSGHLDALPASLAALARATFASGTATPASELNLEIQSRGTILIRAGSVQLRPGIIALVLNDLTTARHFEGHLRKLDRLANAGTLAASMAHEIKNALVAGKTFMDLLLEKNQNSELVDVVRRELARIEAIVSRMLNLAAPGKAAFAAVHLHPILEHSLSLIQPQLESAAISWQRSFLAASDVVEGDEYELQQAFVNLLLNAFEAMGPGGALTVTTALVSPRSATAAALPLLSIVIQDTGTGIRSEHLPHLFEPFFTTKPTGTGLGLAVTKRIVQEHHGNIIAESKPGQGTTFRITLPSLNATSDVLEAPASRAASGTD
jgi:signal transduction histidine kinase